MNPKRTHRRDANTGRQNQDDLERTGDPDAAGAEEGGGASAAGQEARSDDAVDAGRDGPDAERSDSAWVSEIEERERELEAVKDRHLRLAAEYDNFRKRTERERTESWTRAQANLVERILDALDDLERVTGVDAEQATPGAVLEGVQLVERKLLRALEGAGLERIDAEDQPFDPEVHEALVSTPTTERERDDTVAEVFQPGYAFKGVLLRPARVRVHKHDG